HRRRRGAEARPAPRNRTVWPSARFYAEAFLTPSPLRERDSWGCSTFYIHPSNNRGVRMVRVALAFAAVLALLPRPSLAAAPHVLRADLNGDINNITAAYVASEVSRAQSDGSSAFLLVLNTPGGI